MIKTANEIEKFDKENVILSNPPKEMVELKTLVLEKLVETGGIIKIFEFGENMVLQEYITLIKFLLEHGVINQLTDIIEVIKSFISLLNGTTDFFTAEEKDYWFKNVKAKQISGGKQSRVDKKPSTRLKKKPKNLVIFEMKKIILDTLETVYCIGKELNLRRIFNTF